MLNDLLSYLLFRPIRVSTVVLSHHISPMVLGPELVMLDVMFSDFLHLMVYRLKYPVGSVLMQINWLNVMLIIVSVVEFMLNFVILVLKLLVFMANAVIVVHKVHVLDKLRPCVIRVLMDRPILITHRHVTSHIVVHLIYVSLIRVDLQRHMRSYIFMHLLYMSLIWVDLQGHMRNHIVMHLFNMSLFWVDLHRHVRSHFVMHLFNVSMFWVDLHRHVRSNIVMHLFNMSLIWMDFQGDVRSDIVMSLFNMSLICVNLLMMLWVIVPIVVVVSWCDYFFLRMLLIMREGVVHVHMLMVSGRMLDLLWHMQLHWFNFMLVANMMLRLHMSRSLMITKELLMMAQRVMICILAKCMQLRLVNILIALFLNFLVIFLFIFLGLFLVIFLVSFLLCSLLFLLFLRF